MDIVLKLRELRRLQGLSQKDVALRCGVGEKTISSFETGERIGSLKISQLRKLLAVYGVSEAEFFGNTLERKVAPWEAEMGEGAARLIEEIRTLPGTIQRSLLGKFQLMVETASEVHSIRERRPSFRTEPPVHEWRMLTSRN
ncbi:MAG TPA: helix-turn-helix transcriptional regulator [Thermoanaerobaculia bacterium]|nr:helix-turn-helix transcriptional regulator [Thermoanaerobaculia bacterium]